MVGTQVNIYLSQYVFFAFIYFLKIFEEQFTWAKRVNGEWMDPTKVGMLRDLQMTYCFRSGYITISHGQGVKYRQCESRKELPTPLLLKVDHKLSVKVACQVLDKQSS